MFILLILSFFFVSLSKIPVNINYLQQTKSLCLVFLYKLLYFTSVLQIKFDKIYKCIFPQLIVDESNKMNTRVDIYNFYSILFYTKDFGIHFKDMKIQDLENIRRFLNYLTIVTDLSNKNKNKKIIYEKCLDNFNFKFEESCITFISLYLNYKGTRYNINLKTDNHNFYLVDNIIDTTFLKYYITNILNERFFSGKIEYQLELMDHELKMFDLNETQSIIIGKDGYTIV